VEYSVQQLLPIIDRERKKHEIRKHIAGKLKDFVKMGHNVLENTRRELGEDDPVFSKLRSGILAVENAYEEIESFIEKGKIIEDFT